MSTSCHVHLGQPTPSGIPHQDQARNNVVTFSLKGCRLRILYLAPRWQSHPPRPTPCQAPSDQPWLGSWVGSQSRSHLHGPRPHRRPRLWRRRLLAECDASISRLVHFNSNVDKWCPFCWWSPPPRSGGLTSEEWVPGLQRLAAQQVDWTVQHGSCSGLPSHLRELWNKVIAENWENCEMWWLLRIERIVKCDYCWELENCEMWWLLRKRAPCSLANPASKSHLRGCRCPKWWGKNHKEAAPQGRILLYHYLTGTWEQNNTHLSAQNYESWLSSLRRISVKTNKMPRVVATYEYLHGIMCLGPSSRGKVE